MFRGEEVEPPEDMDKTDYDVDPSMMIWKNMMATGQEKPPLKAEEDVDELHHPSMADLLKVQLQNSQAADIEMEPGNGNTEEYHLIGEEEGDVDYPVVSMLAAEEPEQDLDEMYHNARKELEGYLARLTAEYKSEFIDEELEPGMDEPLSSMQMEPLTFEGRYHLEPEEDMDDVYHADIKEPYLNQGGAKADAPAAPEHSEPEEDLDDLHHQ